jgi:hypothetical protein
MTNSNLNSIGEGIGNLTLLNNLVLGLEND